MVTTVYVSGCNVCAGSLIYSVLEIECVKNTLRTFKEIVMILHFSSSLSVRRKLSVWCQGKRLLYRIGHTIGVRIHRL